MKTIHIALVAALLAGCASVPAPAPQIETEEVQFIAMPAVERMSPVIIQPQPVELQIELPLRKVDTRSHQCLAEAMYWEARGEGEEGMRAVSAVILNRVKDERFPDTVCGVIYEGGEAPPCQFSWWCDGKSDYPTDRAQWGQILDLSYTYLAKRPADTTEGALFYHATSIQNPWRRELTAHIGNHIFYR
ncbi:MAG: cell wall hydrolase [Gammaproteobacteria bacterium]